MERYRKHTGYCAAGGSVVAGPISWTPGPGVPDHSCLLAIADTGDDPCASATLDPIVWPFDIARDNNIAQRNIAVVPAPPSPSPSPIPLPFTALNPYQIKQPIEVRVEMKQVEPKELGGLTLDLKEYAPLFEEQGGKPDWLPITVRLRMGFVKAFFLFLWSILLFPFRLFGLIPPKPVTLEIGFGKSTCRFKAARKFDRGLVLETAPVNFGEGGRFNLMFKPSSAFRPGQIYRIDLEQLVDGVVTGGMTYLIVVTQKGESDFGQLKKG